MKYQEDGDWGEYSDDLKKADAWLIDKIKKLQHNRRTKATNILPKARASVPP